MTPIHSPFSRFIWLLLGMLLFTTGCSEKIYRPSLGPQAYDRQEVIKVARDMLGVPYQYGGNSPERGFDCSGLVQYAHKKAGIKLPRTTGGQYRAAMRISYRALRPGDLLFFHTSGRRLVSHVGIYLGKGKFIHAPSSGKSVSIANLKDSYWKKHYTGAGRI